MSTCLSMVQVCRCWTDFRVTDLKEHGLQSPIFTDLKKLQTSRLHEVSHSRSLTRHSCALPFWKTSWTAEIFLRIPPRFPQQALHSSFVSRLTPHITASRRHSVGPGSERRCLQLRLLSHTQNSPSVWSQVYYVFTVFIVFMLPRCKRNLLLWLNEELNWYWNWKS